MKRKIIIYYIVLIIIGITITGMFTSELARRIYGAELEDNLMNSARLITNNIEYQLSHGIDVDYDNLAREYSKILSEDFLKRNKAKEFKTRVTFIDKNGTVLGESETDYRTMENHADRSEVQQAINNGFGKETRFSNTLRTNFLYVSYPVKSNNAIVRLSVPLTYLKNIYSYIWFYSFLGALVGIAITSIFVVKFSKSLINPIKQMTLATKEISRGNYSNRLEVNKKDELGELADNFNQMAITQERTVSELIDKSTKVATIINGMTNGIIAIDREYNIALINDKVLELFNVGINKDKDLVGSKIIEVIRNHQINFYFKETLDKNSAQIFDLTISDRGQKTLRVYTNPIFTDEDEKENVGAIAFIHDITNIKKLEEMRTEFVSNVTHELKTPLTSIRGFVETLRNGAIKDPDVADKFLEIIDIEAERLFILINDILQLSEIETMQKDSNLSKVSINSIAKDVISLLENLARKKGIKLICSVDEDVYIKANRNRIKQMLINLIDNSIKYNVKDGFVEVSAEKAEGKTIIRIKDSGIGISQEHQSRIFERFYRVDKGRSRSMGGTGLGLSIVKHIVNLYGGDISLVSEINKGSEFIIRFPKG